MYDVCMREGETVSVLADLSFSSSFSSADLVRIVQVPSRGK